MPERRLLNKNETGRYLGFSRQTIIRMALSGELKPVQVGGISTRR